MLLKIISLAIKNDRVTKDFPFSVITFHQKNSLKLAFLSRKYPRKLLKIGFFVKKLIYLDNYISVITNTFCFLQYWIITTLFLYTLQVTLFSWFGPILFQLPQSNVIDHSWPLAMYHICKNIKKLAQNFPSHFQSLIR